MICFAVQYHETRLVPFGITSMETALDAPKKTLKKRRWGSWIAVATVVCVILAVFVVWSSLLGRVPVRPSIANGALMLTSRSDIAWTARVTVGGITSEVLVGPRQIVRLPTAAGGGSFEIELLRSGASQPGWTIGYEPPHASLTPGGIDAGAGYSVTTTLSEMLRRGRN